MLKFKLYRIVAISLFLIFSFIFTACSETSQIKTWGGTSEFTLPKGHKLVICTWKEAAFWYLTEEMPSNYAPKTYEFQGISDMGNNAKLIIHEIK